MVKEAAYYKKEAGQNEARVQKMKDDGIDEWTVKKAEEVSSVTIPSRFRHDSGTLLRHTPPAHSSGTLLRHTPPSRFLSRSHHDIP